MNDLLAITAIVCIGLLAGALGVLAILTPYLFGAPVWTAFPMTPVTLIVMVFVGTRLYP